MAKVCGNDENQPDTFHPELGLKCQGGVVGNCEGKYTLTWRYEPIFLVETGALFQPPNKSHVLFNEWLGLEGNEYKSIKGIITCVTESILYPDGKYRAFVKSSGSPLPWQAQRVYISDQRFGLPIFLGASNREIDCEADNVNCRCTDGDEQISCSSAQGGICCIPKSILDALCAKV